MLCFLSIPALSKGFKGQLINLIQTNFMNEEETIISSKEAGQEPALKRALGFLETQIESLEKETEVLLKRLTPLMLKEPAKENVEAGPPEQSHSQIVTRVFQAKKEVARTVGLLRQILGELEI